MIAEILADPLEGVSHVDALGAQDVRAADSRELEDLRRIDGSRAEHDLAARPRLAALCADPVADPRAALAVEQQGFGLGLAADVEVGTPPGRVDVAA